MNPASWFKIVCCGEDTGDLGVLQRDKKGNLWVAWPDGHSDTVVQDSRGWYWIEGQGAEIVRVGRKDYKGLGRAPVRSSSRREANALLARWLTAA